MMKLVKPAAGAIALAMLTAGPLAAPASAQAAAARPVQGVGVVNLQGIIANSDAYRAATQQRPVTYKETYDQANARSQAIRQQLQPLYQKLQTDSQAANANRAALEQQAAQIQQIEQSAEQELQQMMQPVALSQAYVEEQIQDKLTEAVRAAMTKQNVTLLLRQEAVVIGEANNLNQAVLAEINRLIPTAQLVPPQGWLPREMREQQAAQAAQAQAQGQAAPAAAAPAPAAPAPAQGPAVDGR